MDLKLGGKHALVCGSSQGLGRGCAVALAQAGVEVTLNGRSAARLAATRDELEDRFGRPFAAVVADVTTSDGRAALLAETPDLDILVTNAAGPPPGHFEQWGEGVWSEAIRSNMLAPVHMITAVLGPMRRRGWGRIINITSGAVKEPIPLLGLSTAARLGLTGFVASIVREIAPDGVTINNLLPGPFDTERLLSYFASVARTKGVTLDEARRAFLAEVPARRAGSAEEFGELCAFLASPSAGFVTGQNIVIDGGAHHSTL